MIRIDPEFRALIPPLTAEERQQLEINLVRDGCQDALVVWDGVLLDGHHRFEICTERHLEYTTREQVCADRNQAKRWIIENQFGRRNLSPYVRAELVFALEPFLAAEARDNRTGRPPLGKVPQNLGELSKKSNETASKLGKIAGLSHAQISRAKVLANHAPEDVKEKLRQRKTTIHREYKKLRGIKVPKLPPLTSEQHQVAALVLEQFADGEWRRLNLIVDATAAPEADVINVLEHMRAHSTYHTTCERQKGGTTWSYRIVRGKGRTVDVDIVAAELGPLVYLLEDEGAKHLARWSPGTIARIAVTLRQILERLTHQPLPPRKRKKDPSDEKPVSTH